MRLLLDSHIAPTVARELQRHGVDAAALPTWRGGSYRSSSDDNILSASHLEGRVFATYDCRTIPPLLKRWVETDRHHAGVILIDENTVHPSDVRGLLRALLDLEVRSGDEDWEDRVIYLRLR